MVGLAAGGFYLSWSSIRALRDSTAGVEHVEHTQKVLSVTEHVLALLADSETGERGYILTGKKDFLEPYDRAGAALDQALDDLRDLVADNPEQAANASRYRAAATDERMYISDSIRLRQEKGFEAARSLVLTRKGKRNMDIVRSIAALLEGNEARLLHIRAEKEAAAVKRATTVTLLGGGLSLIFLVGAVCLLLREMGLEAGAARRALILQTILDNLGDGVVVADKNGKFLLWNPAAERIIGIGATDTEISEWSQTYGIFLADGKTPYPSAELPLTKAIRGELTNNVELFVRNEKAPEGRWLNLSGRPLMDVSAKLFGGVVLIRDITEQKYSRKRLEDLNENLQHQGRELATANKELEAFSYSVSHDLRAPLRGIAGFSQIVLEDSEAALDQAGKENLARVINSTKLMGTLIDDILELSRVSRTEMQRKRVDMSAFAASIIKDLQERDPSRRVAVLVPPGLVAEGDPSLLRIALVNLIGNAWKYTGKAENARIEFGAAPGADGATVFFVKDNGAGFDMVYSGKLFGAFQRLHPQAEFEGTGIGLAIVQRIIRRQGGRIWAEGAVAKGATFYFALSSGDSNGKQ